MIHVGEINGVVTNLISGNYHLPVTLAGIHVDCPVTGGYRDARNHRGNESSCISR